MAQITYTNKVALNENPEIADINKVTDDNMNEIKQVVNTNYNNTIQITSTQPTDSDNKIWIDTSSLSQSDNTNMKYNDNGTYKDIYAKAYDTLPVGTEVDYDGSTVPDGWTEVADPNTYSTDEVKIGTWIDGKPLYRITITGTLNTTNGEWKDFPLFTADYIDNVVSMIGMMKTGSSNNAFWSIPLTRLTNSAFSDREYAYMTYDKSTANFSIIAYHPNYYADIYSGKTFFATMEYTKTTD